MTISQRLIRAGLTFIILGTAAAAMPQQNQSALAANACSINPNTFAIKSSSGKIADLYNYAMDGATYTSYFNSNIAGNIDASITAPATISNNGSSSITINPNGGSGIATLTATYDTVYVATATVTYP